MTPPPITTRLSGTSESASISLFVSTNPAFRPSESPGIGGIAGDEPVAISRFLAANVSSPTDTRTSSSVLSIMRASPVTTVTPKVFRDDFMPQVSSFTTLFFRANTTLWSIVRFSVLTPYFSPCATPSCNFALYSSVLVGIHPSFRHTPPTFAFSMQSTLRPA